MAYSEYFDINISTTNTYVNYTNGCTVTAYINYYNRCVNGHYNTALRGSHYYNYYNGCTVTAYIDYTDRCLVSYANTWSKEASNKGASYTPTWSSPWGGVTEARTLGSTYIQESVDGLKELRNEIKGIQTAKTSLNREFVGMDVETTSPNVGDAEFNDGNPVTDEKVEDNQYDAIRDSLNVLWNNMNGSNSPVTDKAPGNEIDKTDWEAMASATDSLARTTLSYTNHFNTTYSLGTYTPAAGDVD